MNETIYIFQEEDSSKDVTHSESAANTTTSCAIHDRVPIDVKEAVPDSSVPRFRDFLVTRGT